MKESAALGRLRRPGLIVVVQDRPHRERAHVESGERELHGVLRVGGARRVEERVVVVWRRMREAAGVRLRQPRQRGAVMLSGGLGDVGVERRGPARRLLVSPPPGGERVPQVVRYVAAAQDEDALFAKWREG